MRLCRPFRTRLVQMWTGLSPYRVRPGLPGKEISRICPTQPRRKSEEFPVPAFSPAQLLEPREARADVGYVQDRGDVSRFHLGKRIALHPYGASRVDHVNT